MLMLRSVLQGLSARLTAAPTRGGRLPTCTFGRFQAYGAQQTEEESSSVRTC